MTTKTTTIGRAGDVIEIHGHHVGERPRLGEILEVLGEPDHVHYRVRWEDESVSLFYPGSDAIVKVATER
jgi:Domain of unknown function (DUF1918)